MKKKINSPLDEQHEVVFMMLADQALPFPHRVAMLRDLVNNLNPETEAIVKSILDAACNATAEDLYKDKVKQVDGLLKEMKEGPMRGAVFLELLEGSAHPQALVVMDDGTQAYPIVADDQLAKALRAGDRVILEGRGRVLLQRVPKPLKTGEVGQLERQVDGRYVEVSLRGGAERAVFLAGAELSAQLKSGLAAPGCAVIVNSRQSLAVAAIPPQDGLSHYRFLYRGPVPNVVAERDIGAPPRLIEDISRYVRAELSHPEIRRRYGLKRCCLKLLCGASGTGKSLTIAAIHRRLYEIMSEFAGVPIDQLPPRVVRIRQGHVLSMWLGESEKLWERAMDEVEQLADEPFTLPDGRQIKLPVLVVLEEIDGIGRARGQEAIYDRILTTVLQRLDPGRQELADRLCIVLCSTNEAALVDAALFRRISSGSIESFNRLKRKSFMAVLEKHVKKLPAASNNGYTQEELWRRHVHDLTAWLFSPNSSDPGLVELTYAGATTPVIKYRRDFLTGALVDRAVQQAANEAAQAELDGCGQPGITLEQITRAFDEQLRGLVDQMREHNVGNFTDLPDGVRVAALRRVPQPAHLPIEFQVSW